jgi:hypothetical protein
LVILLSCRNDPDRKNHGEFSKKKIRVEIPIDRMGRPRLLYKKTEHLSSLLHLDDLKYGFDSLQIRFWYFYPFQAESRLILLKYKKEGWEGRQYYFTSTSDSLLSNIRGVSQRKLIPKSGYPKLWDKLHSLHIETIPNSEDVGVLGGADGTLYAIEYATKNSYRYIDYPNPAEYKEKNNYAMKIHQILKLLDLEFSIDNYKK